MYLLLRFVKRLFLVWIVLGVTACRQVALYSNLPEKEGNEILAILLTHHIAAEKTSAKTGVSISVEDKRVADAIEILHRKGYPHDSFVNLGQVFKKEGLISSPMEERVRFHYGLSQSIAETLTQIDGVLTARVHIVLPSSTRLDDLDKPSSASVFIKHRSGFGIEESIPKIKMIVRDSVEGLTYDNISVALFPSQEKFPSVEPQNRPLTDFLGIEVVENSATRLTVVFILSAVLVVFLLGSNGYLLWRIRHGKLPHTEEPDRG